MHLVNTDDFETVKGKYIDVIENTPDIEKYARWIYGKHPTDESLKAYIDRGEMYVFDGWGRNRRYGRCCAVPGR